MTSYPIDSAGFRVFRGYQRANLAEERFLSELGEVFMPGTPLMLRDLGLAAYLPAVVPKGSEVDTPDEVAIIAYASAETYDRARNESLGGRLYTYTHRGVFDMDRSRSLPPAPLGPYTGGVVAFCIGNEAVDWQTDGHVVVLVGERRSGSDTGFGAGVCQAFSGSASLLKMGGCLQVIGQVSDAWVACWFLLDGFGVDAMTEARAIVDELALPIRELLFTPATRLIWRDKPPAAPVSRGTAWTYVFERDGRHFLR